MNIGAAVAPTPSINAAMHSRADSSGEIGLQWWEATRWPDRPSVGANERNRCYPPWRWEACPIHVSGDWVVVFEVPPISVTLKWNRNLEASQFD